MPLIILYLSLIGWSVVGATDVAPHAAASCPCCDCLHQFMPKANTGDHSAEYEVSRCYQGLNEQVQCKSEPGKSVHWLGRAAKGGFAEAQHQLGWHYIHGGIVAINPETAVKWWRSAAKQKHAPAIYDLAQAYEYGAGVASDLTVSKKLYEEAAALGEPRAAKRLKLPVTDLCQKDAANLCPGVAAGEAKVTACLIDNQDKVSTPCLQKIAADLKLLDELQEHCESDINVRCSEDKSLYLCLKNQWNYLKENCKSSYTAFENR